MADILLRRYYQDEDVTLGFLSVKFIKHLPLYTLENPWKDNHRNISCIPEGIYRLKDYSSLKYQSVFEICEVPNRTKILFHIGNYPEDTRGCILPGLGSQFYGNRLMVTRSGDAMRLFKEIANDGMSIEIRNEFKLLE